jgi:uncharacterized delta-60 repeat protein
MGIPSFLSSLNARRARRSHRQSGHKDILAAGAVLCAAARTAVEPLERRVLLAAASLYTITEIPPLGGSTSEAAAVNDSGQAAVSARTPASSSLFVHAARFSGGNLTDLGTVNGGDESQALGINNAGRVVGSSDFPIGDSKETRAFISGASGLQNLGVFSGGTSSVATAVNNSDAVVGYAQAISDVGPDHAFIWEGASLVDLGTLSGFAPHESRANGINNNRQVVGFSTTESEDTHAFLWDGTMHDLGALSGSTFSTATGLNDAGVAVGQSATSGGAFHAVRFDAGGGVIDLGALSGDAFSIANDINGAGDAVGTSASDDTLGDARAVIYSGSSPIDLNNRVGPGSGWTLLEAFSINETGQIVGVGTKGGARRGFLLTPQDTGGTDTTPPSVASIVPADVSEASTGATSHTVTVTYTDNEAVSRASIAAADITVQRGSEAPLTVTGVTVTPDADGASLSAVYSFTPPGGSWDAADDGGYIVTVKAGEVADASGNTNGLSSATFTVNLGQFAPISAAINPVPDVTSTGGTTQTVTVVYTARGAGSVNASTIDAADITISGPGSPGLAVTSVTLEPSTGNADQITATYTLTPPGGSWDDADNGTYTVVVNANQVADTDGNFAPSVSTSFAVGAQANETVLDPTFGGNGFVITPFVAEALVTDSGGHVYLVGYTGDLAAGTSRAVIQRLNVDGSPDNRFGQSSQVISPEGTNDAWYAVTFDTDGRLVVAGTVNGDFAAARFKTNGDADRKFGDRGVVLADLGTTADAAYAVGLAPDGSVVLGGGSGGAFAFAKFTADGIVDGGFGTAGKAAFDAGAGDDVVGALMVTPDNTIVAAGGSGDNVAVVRLSATGTPDAAFSGGNVVRLASLATRTGTGLGPDRTIGLALQSDGELLVANRTAGGDFGVVRINTDGSIDDDFGTSGIATIDFGGDDDPDQISLQGTGEIFVIGTTDAGGIPKSAVAALTPEGDLNTGFAEGGKFTIEAPAVSAASGRALQIGNLILRAFGGVQFDGRLLLGNQGSGVGAPNSTPLRRLNVPGHGIVGSFGQLANGRRRPLRFLEADGTQVTVSLKGGGSAQALYDGTSVDLILSDTTERSKLLIVGRRGDGRITVRDIRSNGSLGAVSGRTATLSGTMSIDGDLGKANFERITGTLAASGSIGTVGVRGDVSGGRILAGADLGAGGKVGGTGTSADTFAAASIDKITVRGPVSGSVIGAGLDPVDGEFNDNDNVVVGGTASVIRSILIRGGVDPSTKVYAGAFGRIRAPGTIDPATSPNFEVL